MFSLGATASGRLSHLRQLRLQIQHPLHHRQSELRRRRNYRPRQPRQRHQQRRRRRKAGGRRSRRQVSGFKFQVAPQDEGDASAPSCSSYASQVAAWIKRHQEFLPCLIYNKFFVSLKKLFGCLIRTFAKCWQGGMSVYVSVLD